MTPTERLLRNRATVGADQWEAWQYVLDVYLAGLADYGHAFTPRPLAKA
jgi:hypothetical protein